MSLPTYNVQDQFQGSFTARRKKTTHIVAHHAAALYPTGTGLEDVRAVANYHTKTKGWPGIGYHICLAEETNGGRIARYNVSDLELVRAHVAWWNDVAVGVSCLTNFTGLPERKWIDALAEVLAELQDRYPAATIVGHKDIALGPDKSPDHLDWRTACPGPRWLDWKPELLSKVQALGTPAPQPPADPWSLWGPIDKPEGPARQFGIAQAWFAHRDTLGQCLRGERYDVPGRISRAIFQGGEVRYLKLSDAAPGRVDILPYPVMFPVPAKLLSGEETQE